MHLGLVASAFGLGATLGLLPGPVQFLLLSESTRGGMRRGFSAMAGANGMFGALLLALAAGLSLLAPSAGALRGLKIAGGAFLLFLAWDALRETLRLRGGTSEGSDASPRTARTPFMRGVLAVVLNPGAWIFLATTASALFASAVDRGGRPLALFLAVAMLAGVSAVDGSMVLLGGGVRRFQASVARILAPILGAGLAAFGMVLIVQGLNG
jgi:threonine/homoserine/homoserine lactone efflux protein